MNETCARRGRLLVWLAVTALIAVSCGGSDSSGPEVASSTESESASSSEIEPTSDATTTSTEAPSTSTTAAETSTTAPEPVEQPNAERILTDGHSTLDAALALELPVAGTLGYSDRASVPDYLPDSAASVEEVGNRGDINFEVIAAFAPDAIVANAFSLDSIGLREPAEELARVVAVETSTFVPWQTALRQLGEGFGVPQRAEDRIAEAEALFAELRESLTDAQRALEVSVIRCAFGQCRYLPGGSSFPGMVLDDVGIARPEIQRSDPEGRPFVEVSFEQIDLLTGDVIVLFGTDAESELEQLQGSALWDLIPAVQNDLVFTVDGDAWFSGNVLAAEYVARDIAEILASVPG
ncbi:MAG: ABC transporter substrate-binding protein [Actinomycetota bacterium]